MVPIIIVPVGVGARSPGPKGRPGMTMVTGSPSFTMPFTSRWLMYFDIMYSLAKGQLRKGVCSVAMASLPATPMAAMLLV